uniref:FHOD1/3-like FH3 domain-containing protein n=1 Tax=Stegastes partitus TaxID=144197 RepID=A0A3B5BBU0_9TELE
MLYVDGMNGLISHNETVQWLYTLVGSKFRLVVKTSLKLLLVFVEYTECNAALLIKAVNVVDAKRGTKLWSNVMEILDEKDGVDTELLVFAMTLINKVSEYDLLNALQIITASTCVAFTSQVSYSSPFFDLLEQCLNTVSTLYQHLDNLSR